MDFSSVPQEVALVSTAVIMPNLPWPAVPTLTLAFARQEEVEEDERKAGCRNIF
jgi:dihydroorotase